MNKKTVDIFIQEIENLKNTVVKSTDIKKFAKDLKKIELDLKYGKISEEDFDKAEKVLLQLDRKIKRKNKKSKKKTIKYFIQDIDRLKNTTVSPETINEFAYNLELIQSDLEEGLINEEEFKKAEEKLLELAEYLEKQQIEVKKPVPIKKEETTNPPDTNIKPVANPVTNVNVPGKTITEPNPISTKIINKPVKSNLLDYKKAIDKRLEQLQKIKKQETGNEVFEYFTDQINVIIEELTFAFEDSDFKELYIALERLETTLSLTADQLEPDELSLLRNEIDKLKKFIQEQLFEKGAKLKNNQFKLKEDTIKGKVKRYIKEQKFEGIGSLLFAITDSPLLMLLGKEIDDFFGERREKKDKAEEEQLKQLEEVYKLRNRKEKKRKLPKIEKKEDIIDKVPGIGSFNTPSISPGNEDEEYRRMVSDLKGMAEESADELGLDESEREQISKNINDIEQKPGIKDTGKTDNQQEQTDTESDTEKESKVLKKKILKEDKGDKTYELLKKHLPNIDINIEKLAKKYSETNDEQSVTNRDQVLKNISLSLDKSNKTKDKEKIKKDSNTLLNNPVQLLKLIGKGFAITSSFLVGWKIGKEIDDYFGLTPKIQKVVDFVQPGLKFYQDMSLAATTSKEQVKRIKKIESLKEKLNITRFTNKESYDIVNNKKELLNNLTKEERDIVVKRAEAYKKSKPMKDIKTRFPQDYQLTSFQSNKFTDINSNKNINKTENKITSPGTYAVDSIVNKAYESYVNKNLQKFENEKADNILNDNKVKKTINKGDISNLSFPGNVHIEGLNPVVKQNLFDMAAEYREKTGKLLPINSAFRTLEEQKRLFIEKPGIAARPGTSMHEKGLAIDIDKSYVRELKSTRLLQKYGFNTPVKSEPWHIEPTSIRNYVLSNIKEQSDMNQVGDRLTESTVNNRNINRNQNITNNQNSMISQNNYIVTPSDFRTYLDDPFIMNEIRNNYS